MEKFDSFFESLSESSLQNTKKKKLDTNTSLYIRISYRNSIIRNSRKLPNVYYKNKISIIMCDEGVEVSKETSI
jgi:hypothetical protein